MGVRIHYFIRKFMETMKTAIEILQAYYNLNMHPVQAYFEIKNHGMLLSATFILSHYISQNQN